MRAILAFVLVFLSTVAASAADPIFPQGSAIGLTPPPGMVPATNFSGFRDNSNDAIIVLTKLPANAFDGAIAFLRDDAAQARTGAGLRTRENLTIGGNPAFLAMGNQVNQVSGTNFRFWTAIVGSPDGTFVVIAQYPEAAATPSYDEAMRTALTSITLRPEPSTADQAATLAFTLPDLGKFRVVSATSGLIAELTDGPKDMDEDGTQTDLIIAVNYRVFPEELRQTAAHQGFQARWRLQLIGIDSEKSMTIGGLPAYETIGRVHNEKGIELKAMQWVIFGMRQNLILDVTSRPEQFDLVLPQLVAIRDGVHLK